MLLFSLEILLPLLLSTGPRTQGNQTLEYLLSKISTGGRAPQHIQDVDPAWDCSWRKVAFAYAPQLQQRLDVVRMRELHDSLQLTTTCGLPFDASLYPAHSPVRTSSAAAAAITIIIAPMGNDATGDGTEAKPLATLGAALKLARSKRAGVATAASAVSIQLRSGTYHVPATLVLNAADSHLTITTYEQDAAATISGGRAIADVKWAKCGGAMAAEVWCATLSDVQMANSKFDALQIESHAGASTWERATLARFPNANAELDLFPAGYITEGTVWGAPTYPPYDVPTSTPCDPNQLCGKSVNVTIPVAVEMTKSVDPPTVISGEWHGMYQNFTIGVGGACEVYDPPQSPW